MQKRGLQAEGDQNEEKTTVLDAFALIISGVEGPPAYPGIPGHEPDPSAAREHAQAIDKAMNEVA